MKGVAEYLLAHESMDGETFEYYCEHGEFPPEKPDAPQSGDEVKTFSVEEIISSAAPAPQADSPAPDSVPPDQSPDNEK